MANVRADTYHNLANLLEAGIPMVKALRTAVSGMQGPLRRAYEDMADFVAAGNSLAVAMSRHPRTFKPLDILLVEAGETAGNLPAILNAISEWYTLCLRLKRTLMSGMILPAMIFHVAAIIIPFPSTILGQIPAHQYWLRVVSILAVMYVPVGLILGIVYLTPGTGPLRRLLDGLVLRIPLLGRAVRRLALSRYLRVFSMLYKAGVPVVQSAEQAAASTGNAVVGDWVGGGARSARAGRPVFEGFSRKVPREIREAWEIGEESGDLDEVTARLAKMTGQSAEQLFTELSTWLPRLIYFVICIWMAIQIVTKWTNIFSQIGLQGPVLR